MFRPSGVICSQLFSSKMKSGEHCVKRNKPIRSKLRALEFCDVIQENKDSQKVLHKAKKAYYRCQETHYDKVPVSILKTDIDWPWHIADLTATE